MTFKTNNEFIEYLTIHENWKVVLNTSNETRLTNTNDIDTFLITILFVPSIGIKQSVMIIEKTFNIPGRSVFNGMKSKIYDGLLPDGNIEWDLLKKLLMI